MFYCSHECQEEDWKAGHKFKECDFYAQEGAQIDIGILDETSFGLLLLYLIKCKFEEGFKEKPFVLFDGRVRTVDDSACHVSHINKSLLPILKELAEEFISKVLLMTSENHENGSLKDDEVAQLFEKFQDCVNIKTRSSQSQGVNLGAKWFICLMSE